ncbi:TPA: DUF2591 domain-containing protein [Morganella morganii]|nr:DUF2591 domain-containing protein [Morganella morganii]
MNKYRDKSDFEINVRIANILLEYGQVANVMHINEDVLIFDKNSKSSIFNPCNNPTDAMPIVIDNKISLRAPSITDRWKAEFVDEYGNYVGYRRALNKNPYRAAMEIFLMMKNG